MSQPEGPQLVFLARNNHAAGSGRPPELENTDASRYYGYFENEYAEQWVFVYDYQQQRGSLRGGDISWQEVHEVLDGQVPGLVLGELESRWLQACWAAVKRREKPGPGSQSI